MRQSLNFRENYKEEEEDADKEIDNSKDLNSLGLSDDRKSEHNKFQVDETSIQKEETDFSMSTVGHKFLEENAASLGMHSSLNNEEIIRKISQTSLLKKHIVNPYKEESDNMVLLAEFNRNSELDEDDDKNMNSMSTSRKKRRTRAERLGRKDPLSSDSNN